MPAMGPLLLAPEAAFCWEAGGLLAFSSLVSKSLGVRMIYELSIPEFECKSSKQTVLCVFFF